jgi:hypothetical protein
VVIGSVIVVIAAVIGVVVGLGSTAYSISYKDGYSAGVSAEKEDSSTDGSTNDGSYDCNHGHAGIGPIYSLYPPNGDNVHQWITGCEAGYNKQAYRSNHPGAS